MNPILMICYNNLELTKKAVESVLTQTIPVHLTFVDNGSTDGTSEWIESLNLENISLVTLKINTPVVQVSNAGMADLFRNHNYILGVPNDVILSPNLYEEFLSFPRGIVTGSEIRDIDTYHQYITAMPPLTAVSENTPMAVVLVRKWAHDALVSKDGYFFDEQFVHFVSDCDLALRMCASGIRGIQLNSCYWHYGSASVRLADPFTMNRIRMEADVDRAKFVAKWGFRCDSLEYGQCPTDLNFRAVPLSQPSEFRNG